MSVKLVENTVYSGIFLEEESYPGDQAFKAGQVVRFVLMPAPQLLVVVEDTPLCNRVFPVEFLTSGKVVMLEDFDPAQLTTEQRTKLQPHLNTITGTQLTTHPMFECGVFSLPWNNVIGIALSRQWFTAYLSAPPSTRKATRTTPECTTDNSTRPVLQSGTIVEFKLGYDRELRCVIVRYNEHSNKYTVIPLSPYDVPFGPHELWVGADGTEQQRDHVLQMWMELQIKKEMMDLGVVIGEINTALRNELHDVVEYVETSCQEELYVLPPLYRGVDLCYAMKRTDRCDALWQCYTTAEAHRWDVVMRLYE